MIGWVILLLISIIMTIVGIYGLINARGFLQFVSLMTVMGFGLGIVASVIMLIAALQGNDVVKPKPRKPFEPSRYGTETLLVPGPHGPIPLVAPERKIAGPRRTRASRKLT